jgi:hypothetical protein
MMIEQRISFGVCGVQAAVVMAYMLVKTEPSIVTYTTRLSVINGTTDVQLFTQEFGVSPLVLVSSILILLFAAVTHQMNEQQLMDNVVEYGDDSVLQAGMWNGVTWLMFLAVHASAVSCIASPVDTYLILFALFAMLYSVACICQPGVRPNVTVLTFMYLAGVVVVFNNMPVRHGPRIAAFVVMVANDFLLVLGHVYDPRPNMLTVGNSRLVHAAVSSLLLLTIYGI